MPVSVTANSLLLVLATTLFFCCCLQIFIVTQHDVKWSRTINTPSICICNFQMVEFKLSCKKRELERSRFEGCKIEWSWEREGILTILLQQNILQNVSELLEPWNPVFPNVRVHLFPHKDFVRQSKSFLQKRDIHTENSLRVITCEYDKSTINKLY